MLQGADAGRVERAEVGHGCLCQHVTYRPDLLHALPCPGVGLAAAYTRLKLFRAGEGEGTHITYAALLLKVSITDLDLGFGF